MEEKPARCTVCGDTDGDMHNTDPISAPPHKFTTEGERQMYRLIVVETLQRDTEVALTAEQYEALRNPNNDSAAHESAVKFMLDRAVQLRKSDRLEWVCTAVYNEDDEEVYDV